jgi:DNA-binding XRE family transcriptional regulator
MNQAKPAANPAIFQHCVGVADNFYTMTAKAQEINTSYGRFSEVANRVFWQVVAKNLDHRKPLGLAIRNYRKKLKMTQERLGEKADLNPKYIGEVERMEKTISVDALFRIATALKIRLRDLVADV